MVFNIPHLHQLREHEVLAVAREMPPGAVVLEIGAGTGFQSKLLSEQGFRMTAVDLPQSDYAARRVYPVTDYDGKTLPLPSNSVDVVFSSNVLEHVVNLHDLQSEIRRVLKPQGVCLHIMPSPSWRLWSLISGWFDLVPAMLNWMRIRRGLSPEAPPAEQGRMIDLIKAIAIRVIPIRHGERGLAITELWTFSRSSWCKHFVVEGFNVEAARPMGLFYTGFMLLGQRLSLGRRQAVARWLGSACNLYRVRPR